MKKTRKNKSLNVTDSPWGLVTMALDALSKYAKHERAEQADPSSWHHFTQSMIALPHCIPSVAFFLQFFFKEAEASP